MGCGALTFTGGKITDYSGEHHGWCHWHIQYHRSIISPLRGWWGWYHFGKNRLHQTPGAGITNKNFIKSPKGWHYDRKTNRNCIKTPKGWHNEANRNCIKPRRGNISILPIEHITGIIINIISFEQPQVFIPKGLPEMVFFLIKNVLIYTIQLRMSTRKSTIASLPGKRSLQKSSFVNILAGVVLYIPY